MAHVPSKSEVGRMWFTNKWFTNGPVNTTRIRISRSLPWLLTISVVILSLVLATVSGITTELACPDGCSCDTVNELVDCSGRGIDSLAILLSSETRLLLCQDNAFQWISPGNFNVTNLRRLRKLSLANNRIAGVSKGSFANLVKIIHLDMSGNVLFRIPHDIRHLKSLNELDLSNNHIRMVTSFAFHNSSRLEVVLLPHNQIDIIDSHTFTNVKYLQVLSLQNNSISNISSGMFSRTRFLEDLDLSRNRLGEYPVNVSDWFKKEDVLLKRLLLNDNHLQELTDDSFQHLTSLETLHIHSNFLTRLDPYVFHDLQSLQTLLANANQIEALPLQLLEQMTRLEIVDFSNNALYDIPAGTFTTNMDLGVLNLAGNQLSNVECLLHGPTTIRELYLSNNQITYIHHSVFIYLIHLQVLQLQKNLLETPPRLWNSTKLAHLDLSGNMISRIPSGTRFYEYYDLTFLSLAGNSLTTLDEVIFSTLPDTVEQFLVGDNPFHCDCRLRWLDDLYFGESEGFWLEDTYYTITCDRPLAWQGEEFHYHATEVTCSVFADVRGILGLVAIWLFLVSALVFAYWRHTVRTAHRRMKAWKPKRRESKRWKVGVVGKETRNGLNHLPKANGKVVSDEAELHVRVTTRTFDNHSYHSVKNAKTITSPSCVCLIQHEENSPNSDFFTETTV